MKKITLNFKDNSKIHIGDELDEYISSDRVYSIIVNQLSFMYGTDDLNKIVEKINSSVLISSAFLGLRIKIDNSIKCIDFLPKPFILIKDIKSENEEKELTNRKKYKKISWLSSKSYSNICKRYDESKELINYSFDDGYIFGDKYYVESDELDSKLKDILSNYKPIGQELVQQNIIDRYSKESINTYYSDYKVFCYARKENITIEPYLYFYIDDEENVLSDEDIKSIQLISIGGKRTLGAGVVESIDIQNGVELNCSGNLYVNISVVSPKVEETDSIERYSLVDRNGYIFSKVSTNMKKPAIRMIKEGSIFNSKIQGNILSFDNYKEELGHTVFTYGKAFLLSFGGESVNV